MTTDNRITLNSQGDCERAPPALKPDGTPKSKLYSLGGGLCLQVTPGKKIADNEYVMSRSWLFRFTFQREEHRMGMGPLSELTLNEARLEAAKLQSKINANENPLATKRHRDEKRHKKPETPPTFEECAKRYIAIHEDEWSNDVYRYQWRRTMEMFVYPVIGSMPIADIDERDILKVLEPIWRTHTKTARDLRGRIAKVFGWAAAKPQCYRTGNPAIWRENLEFSLPQPGKVTLVKNHPAIPYANIAAFIAELRKDPWIAARALEFAILCASRTGEVRFATWGEVNLDKRTWTIPKTRMKMRGKQNRDDHVVPLSTTAVAILKAIRGNTEPDRNALIFTGVTGKRLAASGLIKTCRRIDPSLSVHGFRSSFSDWAGDETQASEETIEFSLAHVKTGVAGRYRRKTAIDKRRVLLQQWADYCNAVPETKAVANLAAHRKVAS